MELFKRDYKDIVEAVTKLLLDSVDPLIVAIDGTCTAGKTTLANYLEERFECNVFHMDDFFLQNEQRTEERFKEVGGNVDYEHFQKEVISPILEGKDVLYRPFRCDTRSISGESVSLASELKFLNFGKFCFIISIQSITFG